MSFNLRPQDLKIFGIELNWLQAQRLQLCGEIGRSSNTQYRRSRRIDARQLERLADGYLLRHGIGHESPLAKAPRLDEQTMQSLSGTVATPRTVPSPIT